MCVAISAWCLGVEMALVTDALAAPPPGADPNSPIARWIRTLTAPDGRLCCSSWDCRRTALQFNDDGTRWAWIGKDQFGPNAPDDWRQISERVWLETKADGDPPDGRAYVCFWGGEVKCARSASGL